MHQDHSVPVKYSIGSTHETSAGKLEIIGREGKKAVVKFLTTGSIKTVYAETISRGNLKDDHLPSVAGVGYLGTGEYQHRTHGDIYNAWASMLKRCYTRRENNPSYEGCTVCEEWKCFQNFAKWVESEGLVKGMQLDKDILVPGNKVYSPLRCSVVTAAENLTEMNNRMRPIYEKYWVLYDIVNDCVISGMNKRQFIQQHSLNNNFFSQLERGNVMNSKGYRMPTDEEATAYFALAGECDGNVRR